MRRTYRFAFVAAAMGWVGCTAGDVIHTSDARADTPAVDVSPLRDVPGDDARVETGIDAASVDVTGTDVPPADTGTTPDVPVDTGPPLPVSCERTGAPDCMPSSAMGRCPDGPSVFSGAVNAAIDAVIAENPSWFVTAGYPSCCPLIQPANVNDYMQAVTDHLAAVGLCASGPGEELGVKYNSECSEAWDIVANPDAATNLVRRHYVGDCFPAFF